MKNYGTVPHILAVLLSLGGVWALPWMLHLDGERERLGYSNSIFSVFLFFVLFWLINRAVGSGFSGKKSRWLFPGLFGVLFSGCMVFGAQLDQRGSVPFQEGRMWLSILILAAITVLLVRYFWDRLAQKLEDKRKGRITGAEAGERAVEAGEKAAGAEKKAAEKASEGMKRAAKGARAKRPESFFLTAAVIFLCYLPVILAVYPGFFVYDAQEEYLQVVTRNFSTHHPLLHVLLLGGIIQLVYKLTDSYNLGIACYTLIQMAVMSFIFAGCVETLRARGLKKAGGIGLTLYFGLCPVLVMFSLCSAKDGLFTGDRKSVV